MEIREGIKYKTSNETDGCVFEIKDNKVYVHFNNNPRSTGSNTINEMINHFEKGTLKLTYYPYKVGDWVIPIKSGWGPLYTDINTPYKLEKADTNSFNREFAVKVEGKLKDISVECLRPAFANEIPISKEIDIEDYSKYEVGCWYKNLGPGQSYIGKLTGPVTKDNFPCKEYINFKGMLSKKILYIGVSFRIFKDATKISLEEVQQYLPNNHPDKIKNFDINILTRNELKNIKPTNMTDDFEEQLARQEQALALANLKKVPPIELKGTIDNKADEEITLKWYTDSLKHTHYKDYEYYKKNSYTTRLNVAPIYDSSTLSSVSPERSSTLNQIKKRSRKVNYVSTTLIMK